MTNPWLPSLALLALGACLAAPDEDSLTTDPAADERSAADPTDLAPAPAEADPTAGPCSQVLNATHYVTRVDVYPTSCIVTDSFTTTSESCNGARLYAQAFNGSSWGGVHSGVHYTTGTLSGSVPRGHSITMMSQHWSDTVPNPNRIYRTTYCPL